MGVVYHGRDPRFDRPVAIKVLHAQYQRDPGAVARFRSEAVIQAKLNHPHIVRVLDFVADQALLAIVMEHVEGVALDQVLALEGPLAPPRAVRIMDQVLQAVGHAHDNGLVHRDLKPSNILLQSVSGIEYAKVMDFGIAKVLGAGKAHTATSAKLGTIAYMSPEQVRSPKSVDARSDIYSLGVVLHEVLRGHTPFDSDTEYELMRAIVDLPAQEIPPGVVPEPLRFAVARALLKEPERRFQSCAEMRAALDAVVPLGDLSSLPVNVGGPRPSVAAPPSTLGSRRARLLGMAFLGVCGVVGGALLAVRAQSERQAEAEAALAAARTDLEIERAAVRAERASAPVPVAAGQEFATLPAAELPVELSAWVERAHPQQKGRIDGGGLVARRADLDADGVPEWFLAYSSSPVSPGDPYLEVLARRGSGWVALLSMDGEVDRLGLARPGQLADVVVRPKRFHPTLTVMVWNGEAYEPARGGASLAPISVPMVSWIFPDSDRRLIDDQELLGLTVDQLWQARSEIYARRNFAFNTARGRDLVRQLGLAPGDLDVTQALDRMNPTERENLRRVQGEEQRRATPDR